MHYTRAVLYKRQNSIHVPQTQIVYSSTTRSEAVNTNWISGSTSYLFLQHKRMTRADLPIHAHRRHRRQLAGNIEGTRPLGAPRVWWSRRRMSRRRRGWGLRREFDPPQRTQGSGERRKLSQWGLGQCPSPWRFFFCFCYAMKHILRHKMRIIGVRGWMTPRVKILGAQAPQNLQNRRIWP